LGEDHERLVSWASEMQRVHQTLRDALGVARESVARESVADDSVAGAAGGAVAARDLLLHCWGFCQALSGHHRGEDDVLFGALEAERPQFSAVLRALRQDHSMIEYLLQALTSAVERRDGPAELLRHLDGIEAVMDSHFGYEERQLLPALENLRLEADVRSVYGPLA
jgi:hypothetical protein